MIQDQHRACRAGGQGQRRQRQPGDTARAAAAGLADEQQAGQQQPRPGEVELLLHGQRPQVVERLRRREPREVGLALDDQVPVGGVRGRGGVRAAQHRQPGLIEQRHPGRDHGQHHEQGREQPPGAPGPEVGQRQPPACGPLAKQQVRDQVTGQGEEHPDAEQPARCPAQLLVKCDDREHRQCPQPVKTWHVPLAGAYRFRHDVPSMPRPARAVQGESSFVRGRDVNTRCNHLTTHSNCQGNGTALAAQMGHPRPIRASGGGRGSCFARDRSDARCGCAGLGFPPGGDPPRRCTDGPVLTGPKVHRCSRAARSCRVPPGVGSLAGMTIPNAGRTSRGPLRTGQSKESA